MVAGFIRHDDGWFGTWVLAPPGEKRHQRLRDARELLVKELATRAGGEALARREMIVVDGICRDGRAFIEQLFLEMREQQAPPEA